MAGGIEQFAVATLNVAGKIVVESDCSLGAACAVPYIARWFGNSMLPDTVARCI